MRFRESGPSGRTGDGGDGAGALGENRHRGVAAEAREFGVEHGAQVGDPVRWGRRRSASGKAENRPTRAFFRIHANSRTWHGPNSRKPGAVRVASIASTEACSRSLRRTLPCSGKPTLDRAAARMRPPGRTIGPGRFHRRGDVRSSRPEWRGEGERARGRWTGGRRRAMRCGGERARGASARRRRVAHGQLRCVFGDRAASVRAKQAGADDGAADRSMAPWLSHYEQHCPKRLFCRPRAAGAHLVYVDDYQGEVGDDPGFGARGGLR